MNQKTLEQLTNIKERIQDVCNMESYTIELDEFICIIDEYDFTKEEREIVINEIQKFLIEYYNNN